MNKVIIKCFVAALIILVEIGHTQTIDPSYEVGTWQGFRTAAVSYTFDDGTSNQFAIVVPMFNEYGFTLTLFTVIDWSSGNWTALQTAANKGHEVASHTLSHPHLGALNDSLQTKELKNSKDEINRRINGQKCITIAYPYCETGNVSISKQNYIAGRICSGSIESKTPPDFFNISSIICGTQGSIKTVKDFNNRANSAANIKGWLVYLLHGINNDGDGWSPVNSDTLRGSLEYLKANPSKFWVSSFGNVVRYIKERNIVSIEETAINDSSITFQLTDTLDNTIYNYPVTIRRLLPQGWQSALISQNGKTMNSQIVEVNSKKYIMVDVVPDEGDVLILKSEATSIRLNNRLQLLNPILMQNYPNPFNPKTKISYSIPLDLYVILKIFDLYGDEVTTLVDEEKSSGNYDIEFDGNNLSSGIYFCQMQAGNFTNTKKLILLK